MQILLSVLISPFLLSGPEHPTTRPATTLELEREFEGYEGCFVLLDVKTGEYSRYNARRCAERFSPCSTFKIPNSLIGLETGVLAGADHEMKWDGRKNWRKACNRDHTLRTAVRDSVVWYFQRVASAVGEKRMKTWLGKLDYGNRDMSGGLTQFWLDGSLKISANEQVEFMRRFHEETLPMSKETQRSVKEILVVEKTPDYTLRGKTGTQGDKGRKHAILGWFVGIVETKDRAYVFACNLSGEREARGAKAREVCKKVLRSMGVLKTNAAGR